MKLLFMTISMTLFSTGIFANDCQTYGKKLVACYEMFGEFESEYTSRNSPSRCRLFKIAPSFNNSIDIYTKSSTHTDGRKTSRCDLNFFNRNSENCTVDMLVEVEGSSKSLDVIYSRCR